MSDEFKPMTTAEMMAVAVLRGDLLTARHLADFLMETVPTNCVEIPPINTLVTSAENLKCIVHVDGEFMGLPLVERERMRRLFIEWMTGESPVLGAYGIKKVELFQFPERGGGG